MIPWQAPTHASSSHPFPLRTASPSAQVLSDGMLGYQQARKIEDTPFPFPYAQLVSAMLLLLLFVFPVVAVAMVRPQPFSHPRAPPVSLAQYP